MTDILKYVLSDFGRFLGALILLLVVCYFLTLPIRLLLRHWNIRKQGWPPAHLDADGDFKSEQNDDDE